MKFKTFDCEVYKEIIQPKFRTSDPLAAFLLFRINILKRKVFRKKFDIVQSLDFLWKTKKNNVFKEKRRQSFFLLLFSSVMTKLSDGGNSRGGTLNEQI